MNRKFIGKTEIFIILAIVIISLVFIFLQNNTKSASTAEIHKDGELIYTVDLDTDNTFTLDEADGFIFEVKNGAIRVSKSECENQICVNTGFISKNGQTAVCLPKRLAVKTVTSDGFDAIIG